MTVTLSFFSSHHLSSWRRNLPFPIPGQRHSSSNSLLWPPIQWNRNRNSTGVPAGKKSSGGGGREEEEEQSVPSWAKPGSDEPPPWARNEAQKEYFSGLEVPFFVYLLASAITAIAAIGSVFEYVNQRPVFGVLNSDSVFYAPLLGFFAFTGIPTSAFLWFKSVQVANKEAEEQDKRDGYL